MHGLLYLMVALYAIPSVDAIFERRIRSTFIGHSWRYGGELHSTSLIHSETLSSRTPRLPITGKHRLHGRHKNVLRHAAVGYALLLLCALSEECTDITVIKTVCVAAFVRHMRKVALLTRSLLFSLTKVALSCIVGSSCIIQKPTFS